MAKFVIYTFNPLTILGGMEKVLYSLGVLLKENGHQFRIVSFIPEKIGQAPVVDLLSTFQISRYKIPKLPWPKRLRWLIRIMGKRAPYDFSRQILKDFLKNGLPDYCISCSAIYLLNDLAKVRSELNEKFKIFYWEHGTLATLKNARKLYSPLNFSKRFVSLLTWKTAKYFLEKADKHLVVSSYLKNLVLEFQPKADVQVIFNPIKINREVLVKRPRNNKFLFVGRLENRFKNISFLLRGLSHFQNDDWDISIIGTGPDENKWKHLAKNLKIDHKINWLGFKQNPFEKIEECSALFLTSRVEGFPLVLAEAHVVGIPTISSNSFSGAKDIIIPGVNGHLFPEGDMKSFINLLNLTIHGNLLFATPEEIAKTAERFSEEKFFKRFMDSIDL